MFRSRISFLVVICALNQGQAFAKVDAPIFLQSGQEQLADFQKAQLTKNAPILDVQIDQNQNVWFVTNGAVWRWQLDGKKLHRIALPEGGLSTLAFFNQRLYVANNQTLFQITFNPQKVTRYRHAGFQAGKSHSLEVADGFLWWVNESGIVRIDANNSLNAVYQGETLAAGDHVAFDTHNKSLWISRGHDLTMKDLRHKVAKSSLVHHAKFELKNVFFDHGKLFTFTENTILQFSPNLQLIQAIPVSPTRKLINAAISEASHVYMFDDRLVEIYDTEKEEKSYAYLTGETNGNIEKVTFSNGVLAYLAAGQPYVYQMRAGGEHPVVAKGSENPHSSL